MVVVVGIAAVTGGCCGVAALAAGHVSHEMHYDASTIRVETRNDKSTRRKRPVSMLRVARGYTPPYAAVIANAPTALEAS